ncbi:TetR/AcrR family transcriptional regulator [Nonomuraea sp. MCN248]|uniref:TetR/AcrR family transcriptional regulator n=1 Tax=Nonomuraea corallina TaxID=2989783 RepID=A0ABT4S629_9ACTN|nr:TetR/AcrR family transcriptional regulator [Nonomuraea corallina]MDA0632396.1 TetR/AcrR family transcriptional regulator [Nonomuraea corallina]
MPKKVDHDERRAHIAEAVLRIAGRDGLDAATLRDVATEAGMSLGAVQYYVRSKEEMLRHAFAHLGERVTARIMAGIDAEPVTVRNFLVSMATEMLPLDPRRRAERRAWQAFVVRGGEVPELAEALREGRSWLLGKVAELIAEGRRTGDVPPELDPWHESVALLAVIEGLSADLMLGLREPEATLATVRYHVRRILP